MRLVLGRIARRFVYTAGGVLAVLLGLAACSANDVITEDVFVDEAGYSGRLVGEEKEAFDVGGDERFTPSIDDVEAFEAALLVDLDPQIEDPSDYFRLYYGYRTDDITYLYVSAFCNSSLSSRGKPLPGDFVDDGGSCYWQATFNLDTDTIDQFWVNGQA